MLNLARGLCCHTPWLTLWLTFVSLWLTSSALLVGPFLPPVHSLHYLDLLHPSLASLHGASEEKFHCQPQRQKLERQYVQPSVGWQLNERVRLVAAALSLALFYRHQRRLPAGTGAPPHDRSGAGLELWFLLSHSLVQALHHLQASPLHWRHGGSGFLLSPAPAFRSPRAPPPSRYVAWGGILALTGTVAAHCGHVKAMAK